MSAEPTATLDDVLINGELARRPARAPDFEGESRALSALASAMAADPDSVLRRLADEALRLCRADSAGVSLLEPVGGFRWPAVVGAWARFTGGGMPRSGGPCGVALERDAPLLLDRAGRHFLRFAAVEPPLVESLVVPFHVAGAPVGTAWVVAHTPGRKFDPEDARLLTSLSRFAAAAHQMAAARADVERQVRERTAELGRAEERARLALDAAQMGSFVWHPAEDRTEADAKLLDLFGVPAGVAITHAGAMAALVHPDDRDRHEAVLTRALDPAGDGQFVDEIRVRPPDGGERWVALSGRVEFADGPRRAARLSGVAVDVTARRHAEAVLTASEERQAFLLKLSDALRPLTDPAAIKEAAARLLGEHLGVDRAAYAEVLPDGEHMVTEGGWHRSGVSSIAGTYRVADFGGLYRDLRDGKTAAVEDARTDPGIPPAAYESTWGLLGIRAAAAHPLFKRGRLTAALYVHSLAPRRWSEGDTSLIAELGERTWEAVERARGEAKLAVELADAQQLQRISSSLIEEDDADALYGRILDAARSLMRAEMASIQVFVPGRDELFLLAHKGFAPESAAFWEWVTLDQSSSCGLAVERDERVVVPDVERWDYAAGSEDLAHYRRSGIRACQSTVLRSRSGRLVGMISTHWRGPHEPAERELRLLDVLARQAADLIERRAAETALRAAHDTFRHLVEQSPFGVYTVDADFRLAQVSAGAQKVFAGIRPLIGRDFADVLRLIWPEPLAGEFIGRFRRTLATGEPYRSPMTVGQRRGGEAVEAYDWKVERVTLPDGRPGVVCHFYDLSDRQRLEDALRASEGRLRSVAANLPSAAVFVVDHDLRYRLAEGQALGEAGFTPADFEGKTIFEALPPGAAAEYEANYREALAGRPFRVEHAAHGHHYVSHGVPLRDDCGAVTAALAVSYDLTERRRAEEALAASEARFRLLVQSATDFAILQLDPDGNVASWNEGAERILGYAADEVLGRSAELFLTDEDRRGGLLRRELRTATQEGRAIDENWLVRKGGSRFWASGVSSPLPGPGGRPRGFVKIFRDLTERRAAEEALREAHAGLERRVEEALRRALQAERLAAIGQVMAGLAHESRNALQRGQACLGMIALRAADRPEMLDLVGRAQKAQDDLHRLYEDAQAYAAPITLEWERCDLRAIAREAWADLAPGRDAALREEGGADGGCDGSPFQLRQLFRNLLENALAASPPGAAVVVTFTDGPPDGRPSVRVEVRDGGPGFPPGQALKAFEPFYTTKVRGTGLGLAICARVAEAHGGSIAAREGAPGVVVFTLPRRRP